MRATCTLFYHGALRIASSTHNHCSIASPRIGSRIMIATCVVHSPSPKELYDAPSDCHAHRGGCAGGVQSASAGPVHYNPSARTFTEPATCVAPTASAAADLTCRHDDRASHNSIAVSHRSLPVADQSHRYG